MSWSTDTNKKECGWYLVTCESIFGRYVTAALRCEYPPGYFYWEGIQDRVVAVQKFPKPYKEDSK